MEMTKQEIEGLFIVGRNLVPHEPEIKLDVLEHNPIHTPTFENFVLILFTNELCKYRLVIAEELVVSVKNIETWNYKVNTIYFRIISMPAITLGNTKVESFYIPKQTVIRQFTAVLHPNDIGELKL